MTESKFNECVRTQSKRLYLIALSFTKNQADAEDILQNVYLKLWNCKKEFEYHYDFELRVNACDSYGEIWASGANANERARLIHVCIDVKNLCVALCEEALTYLHTVKKEQLANHRVRIVDVAKYCQLIDDTRRNSS